MAFNVSFNGTTYPLPSVGDRIYATYINTFLTAVANNALAKSGGTFTLTADVNFGASYGPVVAYIKSRSSNIASTGVFRLANDEGIGWRNAANSANLLLKLNSSNRLELDGVAIPTISSTDTITNKTISGANNTLSGIQASSLASTTGSGAVVLATGASLSSPAISTPTGIVKGDVGLGNVDNTSDATKNSATATLTNKTIVTPVIDDYLELNEESAPSTPSSGKVRVYAKTDKKIYTKDSAGTELQVGASGSGEINALTTGSTDSTGWSAGTSHSVATDTSNSPLSPITTTSIAIEATSTASESSTSGGYKTFTLPSSLLNKKLKVEFYVTTSASQTWSLSVYQGTTRLALTTDPSGTSVTNLPSGVTQKYTAYFDSNSSTGYTVSLTRTAGSGTTTAYVTGVIVGPGIQPQGAIVGEWQSYTPTGSWTTNTTYTGKYRRVGDSIQIQAGVMCSGAPTSATLTFSIPSGLTIDTTKLSLTGLAEQSLGTAIVQDEGVATYGNLGVSYNSTTSVRIESSGAVVNATSPITFGLNDSVSINFTVPIAEWAGSGTVNLAQNDVEYASVGGTWDADSSTTVYGPGGQTTNGTLSTSRVKTITWQRPTQIGDKLELEMSDDGVEFAPAVGYRSGSTTISAFTGGVSENYGVALRQSTPTTTEVFFARYAGPGATWDGAGRNWPTGLYWRVRKSSAGAAVGFGIVNPGVSSGLVSASGLPGNTTGNAIASGYVGEMSGSQRAGTGGSSYSVRATTAYTGSIASLISLTLNKGVYLVSYSIGGYLASGGPTSSETYLYVGGTAVTNLVRGYATTFGLAGNTDTVPVVISSDSTVVAVYGAVNGGPTVSAPTQELRAIRIA